MLVSDVVQLYAGFKGVVQKVSFLNKKPEFPKGCGCATLCVHAGENRALTKRGSASMTVCRCSYPV